MSVAGGDSMLLLISPRNEDHIALQAILRSSPWRIHGAFTAKQARQLLDAGSLVSVVICEDVLPDGDWKTVMGESGAGSLRPSFIVSSRVGDERLWAEVLNLGAFDLLLAGPFEREEVIRVTESAWLAWNHRHGERVLPRIGPGPTWARHRSGTTGASPESSR